MVFVHRIKTCFPRALLTYLISLFFGFETSITMITPSALKKIGFIINCLACCHSIPLKWNKSSNKLEMTKSQAHLYVWKLTIVLESLYGVYCGLTLLTIINSRPRNYLELTVLIVWGFVGVWVAMIMINGLTNGEDMAKVFNQIVEMDSRLQRQTRLAQQTKIVEKLIFACVYIAVLAQVLWTMIFCVIPTSKGFVYSLVPENGKGPIAFGIFLLFEIYIKWQAIVNIIWDLLFMEIKMLVTSHWIRTLKSLNRPNKMQIHDYKIMHLLNIYLNASHNSSKTPTIMGILLILLLMGFFGTIQFFGKLGIMQYAIFPILINNCLIISAFILVPGAIVHKASSFYFKQIRSSTTVGKITRREAKSLRIFGIRFGFLRAIRYPHIAIFFLALSNYTLSLLVAFPQLEP